MQKTVEMIKEKCSVLENQYTSKDEMKRIIPPGSQPVVAFYAYMSHNEVPGSNDKLVLVFDKIKTNEQGGYDGLSGIFTAPVQGLYGFTFSIRMGCHAYGSFQIIKNGSVEGVVKLDGQEACDSEETSMTAILRLAKGDNVFIRTHTNGLNGEILNDEFGFSSFAGWLLSLHH